MADNSSLLSFLGDAGGTAAQIAGQQKASEAITSAGTTGANTQKDYLGQVTGELSPYTTLGSKSTNQLEGALGENGTFDPSAITNNPAYQFAIQQGNQAGQRQAAAMGNAGNSGTAAMIGNQVAGTASQFYNQYIQNLMGAAGMGQTSATQLGNLTYNTGANISQIAQNSGVAQAGLYSGAGETIAGALNGQGYGYGGYGGYGSGGAGSGSNGVLGMLGNAASGISNWWNSGTVAGDAAGGTINPNDQFGGGNMTVGNAPAWTGGDTGSGGGTVDVQYNDPDASTG